MRTTFCRSDPLGPVRCGLCGRPASAAAGGGLDLLRVRLDCDQDLVAKFLLHSAVQAQFDDAAISRCHDWPGLVLPRIWPSASMVGFHRLSQFRRGLDGELELVRTGPSGRVAALVSWSWICCLKAVVWLDRSVRTV